MMSEEMDSASDAQAAHDVIVRRLSELLADIDQDFQDSLQQAAVWKKRASSGEVLGGLRTPEEIAAADLETGAEESRIMVRYLYAALGRELGIVS